MILYIPSLVMVKVSHFFEYMVMPLFVYIYIYIYVYSSISVCVCQHVFFGLENLQELQCIEYFAGVANVYKASYRSGFPSTAVDIEYLKGEEGKENPFDLLSNSGFARLVWHVGTNMGMRQMWVPQYLKMVK